MSSFKINNSPEYEYLSINEFNTSSTDYRICEFVQNRNRPLLQNIQDYKMQVVSFSIPTNIIPLFNYSSGLECKFTMVYTNTANTVSGNIIEINTIPVVLTGTVPNAPSVIPLTFDNKNTGFLAQNNLSSTAVFSVDVFLSAINYSLQLITDQINLGLIGSPILAPYFIFDPVSGLFSIKASGSFAQNDANYCVNLYSNGFTYELFSGIPVFFDITQPDNKVIYYNIFNTFNNVSSGIYTMTTSYSPINKWIRARKIILTSNSSNINPENLTSNLNVNKKDITGNIIAEYNIGAIDDLNTFYTPITYVQYNENQNSINFIGEGALYQLDFRFSYEDVDGRVWPIILDKGKSFNIKIKFTKYK